MAGNKSGGVKPPDIYFKCHPKKVSGIVVCALCDAVYHKSDYQELKNGVFVTDLLVICENHNDIDLTSVDTGNEINYTNRLLFARLRSDIKEKNDEINKYKNAYSSLKQAYESNKIEKEKLATENQMLKISTDALQKEHTLLNKLVSETDDKNDILKQLNQELNEKNDSLKEENKLLKDKQIQSNDDVSSIKPCADFTYAGALMSQKPKKMVNIPNIIINLKGKDGNNQMEVIKKLLYTSTETQINNLKLIKNKIIIKCKNKDDIEEIYNLIKGNIQSGMTVEVQELKKPKLKISGIVLDIKELSYEDLKMELIKRNHWNDDADIKVLHKFWNKKYQNWNLIVEVSSELYKGIMNSKSIYFGFNRCRTVDDFNLYPCFKCCGFFHSSKNCDKKICGICSGEHYTYECSNKDNLKCHNCDQANKMYNLSRSTNHVVKNFDACESYKYLLQRQINNTDYPYNPMT